MPRVSVHGSAHFPLDYPLISSRWAPDPQPDWQARQPSCCAVDANERAALRKLGPGSTHSGASEVRLRRDLAPRRRAARTAALHASYPKQCRAERESRALGRAALPFLSLAWQAAARSVDASESHSETRPRVIIGKREHDRCRCRSSKSRASLIPGAPRPTTLHDSRERMRSRSACTLPPDPTPTRGSTTKTLKNRCLKTSFQKRNGLSICSCHPYYGLIVCGGGC